MSPSESPDFSPEAIAEALREAVAEALYVDHRSHKPGTNERHRFIVMTPWSELHSGSQSEWRRKAAAALTAAHVCPDGTVAQLLAALEAKDGELARLRVAWQRSLAMLRAAYPHPDHVPLVVERVIDMMAAALAPSTPGDAP